MDELFEKRLRWICETKGLSLNDLCKATDENYKTLLASLARGSDQPFNRVAKFSRFLDVPMEYFLADTAYAEIKAPIPSSGLQRAAAQLMDTAMQEAQMQAIKRKSIIDTMDVMNWLAMTGGQLVEYDALKELFDLFYVAKPEDKMPKPFRVGRESYSTQVFELQDEDHYVRTFNEASPEVLENIMKGRQEALYLPYTIHLVPLRMFVRGRWVEVTYWRLTYNVTMPGVGELTLVFAEPAPSILLSNRGSTDYDLIQQPTNHEDAPQE